MYQNEIIHFKGGMVEYFGSFDQEPQAVRPGWIRINNPCIYFQTSDEKGNIHMQLQRTWGADHLYRKFVDIYCPKDSLQEIRVLDKKGGFYKAYMKEINRVSMNLIRPASESDIGLIGKN